MAWLHWLSFALMAASCMATDWRWVGGSADATDLLNWQDLRAPIAPVDELPAVPCVTSFRQTGVNNVVAQMGSSTFYVGKTLALPRVGKIFLGKTVLNFTSPSSCSDSANYAWNFGQTLEQRNDFSCHKNWINDISGVAPDITPLTLGNLIPCAGDTAYFPPESHYRTFVPGNVSLVTLSNLVMGPTTVTSNTMLPLIAEQFNVTSPVTSVYIGSMKTAVKSYCVPNYLTNTAKDACMCYSSCLDSKWQLAAEANIQVLQQTAAQAQLKAALQPTLVSFRGTFTPSSLAVTDSELTKNLVNRTQTEVLIAAVRAAILAMPAYAATVTNITLAPGPLLLITGSTNITSASLYVPGSTTIKSPLVWASTTTASSSPNATQLQVQVQTTLTPLLFTYLKEQQNAKVASALSSLPAAIAQAVAALAQATNPLAALNATTANGCIAQCSSGCTQCIQGATAALFSANVGLNTTTASDIVTTLIAARVASSDWPATFLNISTYADQLTDARSYAAIEAQLQPVPFSAGSPVIYVGQDGITQVQTLLYALSSQNFEGVKAAFASNLNHFQRLVKVWNLNFHWTNSGSGSRRRRGSLAPALATTFNYTVNCASNDFQCQTINTLFAAQIAAKLNTVLASYSYVAPTCFVMGSYNANISCLTQIASRYCTANVPVYGSVDNARLATSSYIFNLTECGVNPRNPDNSCYDPNYATYTASSQASLIASVCTCSAAQSTIVAASSSSGGDLGFGLGAAAVGGGVAVIAIIVIVVIYRKKRAVEASAASDKRRSESESRLAVAFQNPMYDGTIPEDPYKTNHPDAGDIYDEPAFNQISDKHNPVYVAEGDYLDTSPNMDNSEGYLDTSEMKVGQDKPLAERGVVNAYYSAPGQQEELYQDMPLTSAAQEEAGFGFGEAGEAGGRGDGYLDVKAGQEFGVDEHTYAYEESPYEMEQSGLL